jgi:nucleoside-diphosphate-sugar epimerase
MNSFISGDAGFIGSHLVARLLERASTRQVVVYDNFTVTSHMIEERE